MIVEVWASHGGYVAQMEKYGTIIMPPAYCADNGIATLEDAARDVEDDLTLRGIPHRVEVREDKCC